MGNKTNAFQAQLTRSNGDISAARAKRIGIAVEDEMTTSIAKRRSKLLKSENQIEAMTDLSTDNQNTSLNVISPQFDPTDFANKLIELEIEKTQLELELEVAITVKERWFKELTIPKD